MIQTENNIEPTFAGGKQLPLMEAFYTLQGEGYNTGKAAYFIRIGGCDVGCHWCDVKESWNASTHPLTSVDEIVSNAAQFPSKAVVVTGGEPTIYPLDYLTSQLIHQNIETYIETSGAYPLSGKWNWICLSPKKTSPPLLPIFTKAHELKVIIHNKNDFEWAEINRSKCIEANNHCHFYLQPEWSKAPQMMPLIIDYVMQNPHWKISLQSHKYMHIP